jgi:hypothetical protein
MITPSFSLTATERVLPRLALDFTTAVLDPRITITRALNTATVTNANGSISIVNADLPRFDYANGVCRGLLIEETRANLLINSIWGGAVAGAPGTPPTSWINVFTTGTIATVAPSTYAAGNALTFTCAAQRRVIYQRPSVLANTSYTVSFDIVTTTADVQVNSVVDYRSMPTGATITGFTLNGVSVAGNTNMPIGTHKVTATASISSTAGTVDIFIGLGTQANITSSITISNIQFEAGAFATSYIPTTTTSLTRNADVASMTSTDFSSWWQATTGAVAIRAQQKVVTGVRPWLQFDDTTADNIIAFRGNTTNPELYIKATTDQAQIDAGTIAANTSYTLAGAWNTNDCAAAIAAGTPVTDTSATIPTVTQARIGSNGTDYINGWVSTVRYWPQRITNAEVQAFSKL